VSQTKRDSRLNIHHNSNENKNIEMKNNDPTQEPQILPKRFQSLLSLKSMVSSTVAEVINGSGPKDISKSKKTGAAFLKELEDRREVIVAERRRSQRRSINLNGVCSLASIASGMSLRKADSENNFEKASKRPSKIITHGIREETVEINL